MERTLPPITLASRSDRLYGQLLRNFLLAILGPLDWIFIFGDRNQRLGDKAAGTIVIYD